MTGFDLVVFGTGSQAPTRQRNTNGYLLRWGPTAVLFDPGEGTQRQSALADASLHLVDRVCLTHLHGDHCLGLPGVLQKLALDQPGKHVAVTFPNRGWEYVRNLCQASAGRTLTPRLEPADDVRGGVVCDVPGLRVEALPLHHSVATVGYRVCEPERIHLDTGELERLGIHGPDVGRLLREGGLRLEDGRHVALEDLSERVPGRSFAIVMDTGLCDNAVELARNVDLLLCEATFAEDQADLAREVRHLTARHAATIAREAKVGRLVLTHFSSRYADLEQHRMEAAEVFPDVQIAQDLDVIGFPPRAGADDPWWVASSDA